MAGTLDSYSDTPKYLLRCPLGQPLNPPMPTALDFKSTLEASGATTWGQILEKMVMGNLARGGGRVNEVHYGLGENGKFLVIFIFVHVIIKLRIVNILKSVFSDNALNQ